MALLMKHYNVILVMTSKCDQNFLIRRVVIQLKKYKQNWYRLLSYTDRRESVDTKHHGSVVIWIMITDKLAV